MLRPRNIILYIILFVWDATYPYPINTVKFSWPVGDHINGVPLYLQSIWISHVSCVKANNTGDNSFSNLSINTSCRQKWKKMLPQLTILTAICAVTLFNWMRHFRATSWKKRLPTLQSLWGICTKHFRVVSHKPSLLASTGFVNNLYCQASVWYSTLFVVWLNDKRKLKTEKMFVAITVASKCNTLVKRNAGLLQYWKKKTSEGVGTWTTANVSFG